MSDHAESIALAARQLPVAQREAYLRRACGDDDALRSRVDALLEADASAPGPTRDVDPDATLEQDPRAPGVPSLERSGQTFGRYRLLQPIGEGGFGSVWMAEQREPVRRRVALKIIKLGMDTRQVIARFEAERQALAMMDHPNIAKVLDAGATDAGRPYFVMEYIRGVPILNYCDTEKLDTRARLGLFMKVCHAIQHAHQKGIIHRDIKSSNVLVTMHDGAPVPKVIDFGIAKATNTELTQRTLFTGQGQIIGTPAYMSPEQAEMTGMDIDTRSDIYSLGVLLYELLTGTTPFDSTSLVEAGFAEMMRIIREEEPHKPSTRLSTLGDTATRAARDRRADVQRLGALLRGDLDWIVMKCLEKDRTRRYETASGLAADIQRHLDDEPVLAGPPSTSYRLRKFVRRNRGQVIAGGVVTAALLLAMVGTSAGMAWALREKSRADTETIRATRAATAEADARRAAQANERKAVEETERAERELVRATEIQRLITDMLTSVTPEEALEADTTLLRTILDGAATRLRDGEITDELIAAELHDVVGTVYRLIGQYPDAEQHLTTALEIRRRVLGDDHQNTLNSMNSLAPLYLQQGRYAEAEPLFRTALDGRRRVLGDDHTDTMASINNLAALYAQQGRYDEAEPLQLLALQVQRRALGEEHENTLISMINLAIVYGFQARYAEAESLYLKVLEIQRRVLGDEHPRTVTTMHHLAILYAEQGRFDEAEPMYVKVLEIRRRVLGDEHPETLSLITNLGLMYNWMGRWEDAARMFETSLPIKRRVLGMDHPWTGFAMQGLLEAYLALGRPDDARPLCTELLAHLAPQIESSAAPAFPLCLAAWVMTREIDGVNDPARAIELAQRACAIDEAAGGAYLPGYLDTLALAQHQSGDTAAAVRTQRRALAMIPDGEADEEMLEHLATYEAALAAIESADADGG